MPVQQQGTRVNPEQCTLRREETATAKMGRRGLVSRMERTWRTVSREVLSSRDQPIKQQRCRRKGQRARKVSAATGIAHGGWERYMSNRERIGFEDRD